MAELEQSIGYEDTLVVTDKRLEAHGLVSLELQRPDGGRLPDWTPGAHIDLILPNGVTRPYSLCGDPRDWQRYRVGVLRDADSRGGSHYIHDSLEVGHSITFGGPRNNFAVVPSPYFSFIAGGVGVTPILPMLRMVEQLEADWRLLYLGRSRETMAFLDELADWPDRVEVHAADELGRANIALWLGGAPEGSKLYVCGPTRLLDSVEELTTDWRRGWVRVERFTAREQSAPSRTTPFEVELSESGVVVTVKPDETVANAIRDAGVRVLTSCERGVCGTCETTVLVGAPDHRDSLLDERERDANDCIFPCVSRSHSDRLVLEL
jgi:ferredoxin-NADP reductase